MEKSMSLLEELESQGVTAEDLEKAASVRLFEKAAAAEGVDLDSLDVDQVEELYASFLSNQSYDDGYTKEASAMNDEIIDLFEKTAAAEGIDLEEMADDELAELYEHYVDNVLPEQIAAEEDGIKEASEEEIVLDMFQKTAAAEGLDLNEFNQYELAELYEHYVDNVLPLQMGDKTAAADVAEAQEKLAEAEILGRHMARSYADEIDKLAEESEGMGDRARRYGRNVRKAVGVDDIREGYQRAKAGREYMKTGPEATRGGIKGKRRMIKGLKQMAGGGARLGGATLAVGGAGYGAKKMYDKRKGQTKQSAAFDEVELDALMKIASEFGYDVAEKVAEEEKAKKTMGERARAAGTYVDDKAQRLGKYVAGIGSGGAGRGGVKTHRALGYGIPTVAAGGLAYGAKKMIDRRKEKRASAYDYDDVVDNVAYEMLLDAGFDV
jgi:hypothetical protein